MVEIFDDRVEITSPGSLPKGLREEDFGKISLLRNPNIANLFQRIEYIEKMGTGIQRIKNLMNEDRLDPVEYRFGGFVTAAFKRPVGRKVGGTTQDTTQKTTQETTQETTQKTVELAEKLAEKYDLSILAPIPC